MYCDHRMTSKRGAGKVGGSHGDSDKGKKAKTTSDTSGGKFVSGKSTSRLFKVLEVRTILPIAHRYRRSQNLGRMVLSSSAGRPS